MKRSVSVVIPHLQQLESEMVTVDFCKRARSRRTMDDGEAGFAP